MRSLRLACLALAGLVLASTCAEATTAAERLDLLIPRLMRGRRIAGVSALVVKNGAIAWARNYGWADVQAQVPVSDDTMFMLASTSKTVTAVALMQLVDDGAVGLDDPIDAWLPFAVRHPAFPMVPITFRMLLTHTSSIVDGLHAFDDYGPGDSALSLEDFLADYLTPGGVRYDESNFLADAPGSRYEYSNEGVALAGLLVQRISGMSFEDFCESRIFTPLGMTDTGWRLAGLDSSRIALPYYYSSGEGGFVSFGLYGYPDIPNGALRTTAAQLAKFLLMFMGGGVYNGTRLLESSTVDEMLAPQIPDLDPTQGLIWYASRFGNREFVGHNGSDDGASANMFYEPASGTGIIVLTNDDRDGADPILRRLVKLSPSL